MKTIIRHDVFPCGSMPSPRRSGTGITSFSRHKKVIYPVITTMAVSLLLSSCNLAGKDPAGTSSSSPQQQMVAENLIEQGQMPESLPEDTEWFNFRTDTSVDDYLNECYQAASLQTIHFTDDKAYAVISEITDYGVEDHILVMDHDMNVLAESPAGINGMVLHFEGTDTIYASYYLWDSDCDMICPVDETTGELMISQTVDQSQLDQDELIWDQAIIGDELAVLCDESIKFISLQNGALTKEISFTDTIFNDNLAGLWDITVSSEGYLMVEAMTNCNNEVSVDRYYFVDIESGEITSASNSDWLDIPIETLSSFSGKIIDVTDAGVYEIHPASRSYDLIFSFNCTNCNRYLMKNSTLLFASDDKMIFLYVPAFPPQANAPESDMLCIFERSGSYEQGGKTIISVASYEPLDYATAEALYRFNNESDTCFAVYDERYLCQTDYYVGDGLSNDEHEIMDISSAAAVANSLAIDLMTGDGPDIMITSSPELQLCNSEYFLPLEDYLGEGGRIDTADCFENAFEAFRYDGHIYQMPLTFYAEGIMTSTDLTGGSTGMTFDEYGRFVDSVCGGLDPIYDHDPDFSRTSVAATLFANMSSEFIRDGVIDVNCDAFRQILDYCASLPEQNYSIDFNDPGQYEDMLSYRSGMQAVPLRYYDFYQYFDNYMTRGNTTLIGYPSCDGRSATVSSNILASISATTENVDACLDLLNIFLDDDIQISFGGYESCPVLRSAMRYIAGQDASDYSEMFDNGEAYPGMIPMDISLIDEFEDVMASAENTAFTDHNISVIIFEEVPAYFEGQKTFEEVASTINNRAQTVLN